MTLRTLFISALVVSFASTTNAGDVPKRAERPHVKVKPASIGQASQVDAADQQKSMEADFSTATGNVKITENALDNTFSNSIAYAIDVRNQRNVKINLGTGTVTAFGGPSGGRPFFAGDFNNQGIWYGMSNPDSLYTIDTTSGVYTLLGPVAGIPPGSNTSGLSWDYTTNTMYVANQIGGTATLYTLDIGGLTVTPVGPIVSATIIDIAISNTGQMFGVKFATAAGVSDTLVSINKATGVGTTVGALGVDVNFAHGLDFDPITDSLFYPGYIGGGVNNLYKINTATGAAALVFSLAAGEYDAFAVAGSPPPPPVSLNESFEGATFPPAGWSKLNPDSGPGWNRQVVGTSPVPGWTGGAITAPPGGGSAVAFCTWATGGAASNDQWLITPQLSNIQTGDSLRFWIRWWPNNFADTVEVRISTTTPTAGNFNVLVATLGFPAGNVTDTGWIQRKYKLTDHVSAGSNIYIAFRERIADNLNNGASISLDRVEVSPIPTSVPEQVSTLPAAFGLEQNYPNPFNPSTTIRFSVPTATSVSLRIYNTLGEEVATLVEGQYSAGTYNYQWNASELASGIYFYRLQAGNFTETKKLMLVK